jgi:hypothetical protein
VIEIQGKPQICRVVSLKGFGGVILGRDIGGIFKEGHVYRAVNILGEIILTDLGEHAVPKWLVSKDGKRMVGHINQYATSGVTMLTKEEYEIQLKNEQENQNEDED